MKSREKIVRYFLIVTVLLLINLIVVPCFGQEANNKELTKAAQNPIADLISVPFQNNTNFGMGPHDRTQNILNIQPVIPFNFGEWNLITRTIAPLINQPDTTQSSGSTFGLGDINTTLFLSPAAPGKLMWGLGPIISFPTATDEKLGSEKWGIGPSVVVLAMPGQWVMGCLVNNVWSFAGDSNRDNVNQMTLQYFINYNFKAGWYLSSAPIITANWEADSDDQWLVPFGMGAGKIVKIGKLPLNISLSGYYNAIHPDNVPYADWTLRFQVQFLFPKGKK